MRTSLNEIRTIELYLQDQLSSDERESFEADLRANAVLRINVFLQRKIYTLLKLYRRQIIRDRAELTCEKLLADDHAFNESVQRIFKS